VKNRREILKYKRIASAAASKVVLCKLPDGAPKYATRTRGRPAFALRGLPNGRYRMWGKRRRQADGQSTGGPQLCASDFAGADRSDPIRLCLLMGCTAIVQTRRSNRTEGRYTETVQCIVVPSIAGRRVRLANIGSILKVAVGGCSGNLLRHDPNRNETKGPGSGGRLRARQRNGP
jgi:hypothetical protein